ncbi:hypothetical protein VNI00_010560 [Paramarasmius palmivorus]|uniref:Uncharacterized protein n=1 Tax=Paramarasmius palmivorus TaxID=297713 RepID=A0AAW0CIM8_9AGAR
MEVQSLQARRPDNAHALKEVGLDFVDEAYPWRFPLVRNLPWASGLMRMQEKWNIILPPDLQEASLSLLRGFREASSTNDTFRGIMYNQNTLTPNQKSADPLPALLFASKLLDVAVVVTHAENMTGNMQKQGSVSVPPLVVPRTTLDDQTGKLRGVRTLSDRRGWTRVIRNLQHELNSYKPVKETTLHPSELQTRPNCRLIHTALRLLGALSRKDMNSLVLKVLTNLESTAFFINFLLQGRYDFPSTSSALASVLQQSAEEEGINCEAFRNLPQITRLRQGLYLALSVSPLVLVCDVSPMSSNLSRVDMLRAWYHYGTHRPPVLKSVEMKLWSYLFAIARGSITAIDALQLFVKDAIQKVSLAGKEESFFNADVQSKAVMPTGIAYSATRLSRQFVALTVANTLNDPTGAQAKFGSSQNDSLSSSVDSRGLYESLDVSDILAPELWINGDVDYSSNESLGFDSANTPPASDSTSGDSSSSAQRAADMSNPGRSRTPASDDSLPPSKRRRISAKSRDGPRSPFIHSSAVVNPPPCPHNQQRLEYEE